MPVEKGRNICGMNTNKVHACMIKTFNRMKKRIGFLIYQVNWQTHETLETLTGLSLKALPFQFVLPAIQVSLFCMAVGQDPKQLPVAVVNNELFAHNGTMTESCQNGKIWNCKRRHLRTEIPPFEIRLENPPAFSQLCKKPEGLRAGFFVRFRKNSAMKKNLKKCGPRKKAKFCPKTQPYAGFTLLKNYQKIPCVEKTHIFAFKTQFFPWNSMQRRLQALSSLQKNV